MAWAPGQDGFYYLRFPEPKPGEALRSANTNSKIYLHRLGQPQSDDRLVYRTSRPARVALGAQACPDDGRYLLILVQTPDYSKNLLYYQDLQDPSHKTVELIHELDAAYVPLGTKGSLLYVHTTTTRPRAGLSRSISRSPSRANWREIVAEQKEALDSALMANDRFVVTYLKDAASQVKIYGLDGKPEG